ncbi:MAG: HigA family addiction module antitoxin, partial [Ignavibacteriae bacterium]|nr:HigA family addiction module antitoxin [Ignavibacteriota bacterium]
MNNNNKIRRKLLSPPGDTIQETIDTLGMNQYELAERLGKNIKNVNRIIKGKESITTDTAISLEKVLGISADFWLERERLYRKELAEIEFDEQLEKNKNWVNNFPVSEMEKLNWIPKSASMTEKAKALLTFFGIASPAQWNKIYESKKIAVAFRISLKNTSNPYSISAWLRQGELQAKRPGIKTYNKDIFKNSLSEIKKLSYEHPRDFLSKLQNICNQSGVALVFTPNISNATISGAS